MATVPNYGLLSNMADGIREGMIGYQTMLQGQRQQQMHDMMAQQQGFSKDQNGNWVMDPQRQQEMQQQRQYLTKHYQNQGLLEQAQVDKLNESNQADSAMSKSGLAFRRKLLHDNGTILPDNMTETEQERFDPLIKEKLGADALRTRMDYGQTKTDNQDWEKLSEKVNDPTSRQILGTYNQNLYAAGKVKQLMDSIGLPPGQRPPPNESEADKIKRLDNATPQQAFELAKGLDNYISSGQGSVYNTQHILPSTLSKGTANLHTFFDSGVHPAGLGEILNQTDHTLDREMGYTKNTMEQKKSGLLAGYSHLKNKDPQRWEAVTNPPDVGLLNQSAQTPGAMQSGSLDEAKAWLAQNPNDPRAAKVRQKLQSMGAL